MRTLRSQTCTGSPRGFSLIEVLIAVLVLGVGLLGLASVFPVVISQQRDATDVIRGGVAAAAVRDQIRSNPDIAAELLSQDGFVDAGETDADGDRAPNDPNDNPSTGATSVGNGEPIFGQHGDFQPGNFNGSETVFNPISGFSYLWEADWSWGVINSNPADGPRSIPMNSGLDDYRDDGGIRFRDPEERNDAGIGNTPDLPVQARLYPRPNSSLGGTQDGPLYVWDFVPRRTPRGGVQVAVFIRRIGNGIRVPAGETLSSVLSDQGNRVYPVSWDPTADQATADGSGQYAIPLSAEALPILSSEYPFRPEFRGTPQIPVLLDGVRVTLGGADTEVATASTAGELRALADVGQRFVDNLGVVRTVVEVLAVDGTRADLRVEPAFSLNEIAPAFRDTAAGSVALLEAARVGKLRQILFTPQEPVDVFTMEFNK